MKYKMKVYYTYIVDGSKEIEVQEYIANSIDAIQDILDMKIEYGIYSHDEDTDTYFCVPPTSILQIETNFNMLA